MVDPDGPMGPIVGNGGTRDLALAREYDYEYLDAIMIYIFFSRLFSAYKVYKIYVINSLLGCNA